MRRRFIVHETGFPCEKFFTSLTMTESCINERKSREITSLQERKNSPLGGNELTGSE